MTEYLNFGLIKVPRDENYRDTDEKGMTVRLMVVNQLNEGDELDVNDLLIAAVPHIPLTNLMDSNKKYKCLASIWLADISWVGWHTKEERYWYADWNSLTERSQKLVDALSDVFHPSTIIITTWLLYST